MSKKRTSAESSDNDDDIYDDDDDFYECSDCVLQKEDNEKRAKLTSLSDTTFQDLPTELLHIILVKAVATEVKDMKLIKRLWKHRVGPVIRRLEEVCSRWSCVLTTNIFRDEVNRILDRTPQKTSRLEILHQSPLQFEVSKVTTNKDEIFMLCTQQGYRNRVIKVYDRNNMAEVKEVIQLPRRNAKDIAACSLSSCLYVVYMDFPGLTLYRISKDEELIAPWISDKCLSFASISVSPIGSLIILSNQPRGASALVSIYDADGFLQRKIRLLPDVCGFEFVDSVIQKSNGNLVVFSANKQLRKQLTEIDPRGLILRQYQSSLGGLFVVGLPDIYGRILITASHERIELLDPEFNHLDFVGPQMDEGQYMLPRKLHFNSARNEIVDVVHDDKLEHGALTIFRLTEE